MISIRLDNDIEDRLIHLAEIDDRPKSYYARKLIVDNIDELEDVLLAEKRYREIESGQVKTVPFKDVLKKYDMDI